MKGKKKFFYLAAALAALVYWYPAIGIPILNICLLVFFGWAATMIGRETFFGLPANQAAIMQRRWYPSGTLTRTGRVVTQKDLLPLIDHAIKLPWVDIPKFVERKEKYYDFSATVIAKDGASVTLTGNLACVPDFSIMDACNKVSIAETTDESDKKKAIEAFAMNKLTAIAGSTNSSELLSNSPSIDLMMNGAFRMSAMPHLSTPGGASIPAGKLVTFYKKNWKVIKGVVDTEAQNPTDHSQFEKSHGMDVAWVKVKAISLSAEAQKAKNESVRVAAIEKAFADKEKMIKRLLDLKFSPSEAASSVSESIHSDKTTRIITAGEGSLGALSSIPGALFARTAPAEAGSGKKGK